MRREIGGGGSERAREIPALLFALAWLIGVQVGPALHLARHAQLAPHDHGRPAAHCHGDVCHDDERADEDREAPAPDHGEGSLEHGGLAVLAPAPVIAALPGAPIAEMLALKAPARDRGVLRGDRARARAPPPRDRSGLSRDLRTAT